MSSINVTRLDGGKAKSNDQEIGEVVFQNPSTLKVYLYMRSIQDNEIGIRETQRALNFNSPGSVQWHLDKLMAINIVEKLPNNKYILTESGKTLSSLNLPLDFPFKFMKGQLIPKSNFHLTFSIAALVILLVNIYGGAPLTFSLFLAQAFMIVHVIIYFRERLTLLGKLNRFIEE